MKVIDIPKDNLEYLYKENGMPIAEIADIYHCSKSCIWVNLKKYGIKPCRTIEVNIPKKDLKRLYIKEKLSTRGIAIKYSCGKTTIQSKLKEYNINIRNRSEAGKLWTHKEKYEIPTDRLRELYWKKKLSAYKIAAMYHCSPSAIFHKLIKNNISRRTDVEGIVLTNDERCRKIAEANSKYEKQNFTGTKTEKAYLIGFRLGDLHVAKRKYGETVYVNSHTTKKEQLDLMEKLFEKYGHLRMKQSKKVARGKVVINYSFTANLNLSFSFLLNKQDNIEKWILDNNNNFLSFLGGYIDAEGSFGIYNGFGSFALGSNDKSIIFQINKKLNILGIKPETPRIMCKGGYVDKRGVRTFKDVWSLRIRRKKELQKFINMIKPYIHHAKRKTDLGRVYNIVFQV